MRKRGFVFINSNVNTQRKMCDVKVSTSKRSISLIYMWQSLLSDLLEKAVYVKFTCWICRRIYYLFLLFITDTIQRKKLHAIPWWFIRKHRRNERCETKIRAHNIILICRYFYIVYSSIRNYYLRLYSCDRSKRRATMTTIIALLFIKSQTNGKTPIA